MKIQIANPLKMSLERRAALASALCEIITKNLDQPADQKIAADHHGLVGLGTLQKNTVSFYAKATAGNATGACLATVRT